MDFLNDSGDEEEGEEGGFKINTAYAERYGVAGVHIVHFDHSPSLGTFEFRQFPRFDSRAKVF